jgi:micrococcal nuclease
MKNIKKFLTILPLILLGIGAIALIFIDFSFLMPNHSSTSTISSFSREPPVSESSKILTQSYVRHVLDGDTLILYNDDRVRLIGINAPELGFQGTLHEEGAEEARDFVNALLNFPNENNLTRVWLEADGNNTDNWGRLRRYVWLQEPADISDEEQIRVKMLNAILLENNHAEVMAVSNFRNEQLFRELEK